MYGNASNTEARDIVKRKFGHVFGQPVWRAPEAGKGQRGLRYLNDNMQVVGDEDGTPRGVMWSAQPLRGRSKDGTKKPVDLDLAVEGEALVPRVQLVESRIARRAGEGIAYSSGTGVVLRPIFARPDVSAEVMGSNAFFSNVDKDTDWIVAPLPGGTETFHQLRSSASPESLKLQFALPEDASLRLLAQGAQGAEIVQAGKLLGKISPPSAFDADGEPVPVRMSLDDTVLTLTVEHRGGDWAYPILVDPIEDFTQWSNGSSDFNNWQVNSNVSPNYFPVGAGVDPRGEGNGLYVYTHPDNDYGHLWYSEWYWQAFGTQRVYRTELSRVYQVPVVSGPRNCMAQGIRAGYWYENGGWEGGDAWINGGRIAGGSPWVNCGGVQNVYGVHCPRDCGSREGSIHNRVTHQLYTECCGHRYGPNWIWPHAFLGGALIFYDEVPADPPHWIGQPTHSPSEGQWLNGTSDSFATTAEAIDSPSSGAQADDTGVGVWQYNLTIPLQRADGTRYEDVLRTPAPGCAGQLRCPGRWKPTISYPTAAMPEGVSTVRLEAFDALTQASTPRAPCGSTAAPRRWTPTGRLTRPATRTGSATARI